MDKVANWTVEQGENFSDHNTISFNIKTPEPEVQMKRNYAKLDTKRFCERLEELCSEWEQPVEWSLLEKEAQERKSNNLITTVLDEFIPLQPVKITPNWLNWWTPQFDGMKKKLRKWYRAATSSRANQAQVHAYQNLYKEYKKLIKKTKNEAWKRFCSETETTSDIARLAKIIRFHPKYNLTEN